MGHLSVELPLSGIRSLSPRLILRPESPQTDFNLPVRISSRTSNDSRYKKQVNDKTVIKQKIHNLTLKNILPCIVFDKFMYGIANLKSFD